MRQPRGSQYDGSFIFHFIGKNQPHFSSRDAQSASRSGSASSSSIHPFPPRFSNLFPPFDRVFALLGRTPNRLKYEATWLARARAPLSGVGLVDDHGLQGGRGKRLFPLVKLLLLLPSPSLTANGFSDDKPVGADAANCS